MAKSQMAEVKNEVRQKRLECEALLRSLAESNRYPTSDELFELRGYGLGDPKDLKREVSRLSRKITLEQQAGSVADRQKMAEHCQQCESLLKSETPKLEKAIADAQRELGRLQKDARLSSQRLEQMRTAADRLRDCLPESVKQEFNQRRNAIDESLGRAVSDSEIRLNEIRRLLTQPENPKSNDWNLWADQWRRSFPGSFVSDENNRGRLMATRDYALACNDLRAELEILEPKLQQQREAFDKAVATLDAEMMEVVSNG
jgi:predicted  nucleic acid-binding Zn-ribbon protein